MATSLSAASLLPSPAPSFDDPIGVLVACHERMRRQLGTLARLPAHVNGRGVDAEARSAAQAVLRYFDRAGADHHADEDDSVLPRVLARAPDLAPLIAQLSAEHVVLARRWRKLRPLLAGIAGGFNPGLPTRLVRDVCEGYETHIDREERRLLPRAQECLDATALAEIGREFAARRARTYGPA